MRRAANGWAATLIGSGATALLLLLLAVLAGGPEAVTSVGVAVGLGLGVMVFSLPVLAAMGLSPSVSFLVAMSTYALQVLLGAVLLRAGRPGGALADVLDQTWLGVSLVALAVVVTAGVVVDQLRAARSVTRAAGVPAGSAGGEAP